MRALLKLSATLAISVSLIGCASTDTSGVERKLDTADATTGSNVKRKDPSLNPVKKVDPKDLEASRNSPTIVQGLPVER